ncbi:PAS domain S-box protein [Patescibacteria group bacterium]|nr:PAS domain S-box protein [Patescibacteria group bacterium]
MTKKPSVTASLKEKYRNLVENSNQIFYIQDTKNVLSYVSPQSKKIMGYTPKEMMISWTKLITDNPINNLGFKLTQKALKTGKKQPSYILEAKKKNGTKILVEINESPLKDENGKMIGIAGALSDISDRAKAEKQLLESEKKYRNLVDNSRDVIYSSSINGEIAFISPNCKVYGYSPKEIIGTNLTKYIHPDDIKPIMASFADTLNTGNSNPTRFRIRHKNGKYIWVEETGARIMENGEVLGISGGIRGIQDKVEFEDKLLQHIEAISRAEKIAHLGYFERNWNTGKEYWTDGLYRLQGYEPGEIPCTKNQFLKSIHKEDLKRVQSYMHKSKKNHSKIELKFRMVQKKKKVIHIHFLGENTYDLKNKILLTKGVFQDITEVKESQEKYQSLFDNMSNGFAFHKIVLDKKGTPIDYIFLETNQAFEKLTGTKESIIQRKVTEVFPGIDKDSTSWIKLYGNVALTGKPLRIDQYSSLLKKWYSVTAYSPKKGYFATVFEDITERKNSEDKIRESEEKTRNIVENMNDALILHNIKGKILEVNDNACKYLGYNKKELIGSFLSMIDSPQSAKLMPARIDKLLKKESVVFEGEHITKNGEKIPVSISAKIVIREGEKIVQSIIRNISESKKLENDLKNKIIEMEKFHKITVGRELKMIELKNEIKKLKKQLARKTNK